MSGCFWNLLMCHDSRRLGCRCPIVCFEFWESLDRLRLKTFGLSLFHCLFDFYSLQLSYGSRSCVCPRFGFCDIFQERFVCLLFGILLSTMADDVGLADLFGDCADD